MSFSCRRLSVQRTEEMRCSSPSLLFDGENTLLMAYTRFQGNDPYSADFSEIVISRSEDLGRTWSSPEKIIEPGDFGTDCVAFPTLMKMKNGDISVFFLKVTTKGWVHHTLMCRSSDGGRTFSGDATDCTLPLFDGYHMLEGDSVLRLESGRILIPVTFLTGNAPAEGPEKGRTDVCGFGCFCYSDDEGKTFTSSEDEVFPNFTGSGTGFRCGTLADLGNGCVKAFWGSDMMCQYVSYSVDGGEHFREAQVSAFSSPCSPLKAVRDPCDGSFIAIWNPEPVYNGRKYAAHTFGQTSLVLSRLDPSATRLGEIHTIVSDPETGYSGPSAVFTGKGSLVCAFSSGGKEDLSPYGCIEVYAVEL